MNFGPPNDCLVACDVSADGQIIVGSTRGFGTLPGPRTAFRYTTAGGVQELPLLPSGIYATAQAISADGTVIAGNCQLSSISGVAFRWTAAAGTQQLAGQEPGVSSQALGISADGMVIVGRYGFLATRWTAATGFVNLGGLAGALNSYAYDTSADGAIVVGSSDAGSGYPSAFVWDAQNGMRNVREVLVGAGLNLTGWSLSYAYGVSDDGLTLVGTGINPAGHWEGWIARLPPFPCYANCDGSVISPILNVSDFLCFMNRFAAGDSYANCDRSTTPPTLNISDFICFMNHFAVGCP